MGTRVCKVCGIEKDLEDFGRKPDYSEGRHTKCKRCLADEQLERYRRKSAMKPKNLPWQQSETVQTPHADAMRRCYQRHKEKRLSDAKIWNQCNPEAYKAHRDLNNAIKLGKIVKPTHCERCGKPGRLDGHHHDYSKPFDVEWLCRGCHVRQTRKERESA